MLVGFYHAWTEEGFEEEFSEVKIIPPLSEISCHSILEETLAKIKSNLKSKDKSINRKS